MQGPVFANNIRKEISTFLNASSLNLPIWRAGPNGSRINAISASQDDTATSLIKFYFCKVLTDNARANPFMPPGLGKDPILALTKAATDTMGRTNGSFLADGWIVGMLAAVIDCMDNPQNYIQSYVSAVVAATLSFTGTPSNATAAAGTISAQTKILQCVEAWSKALVNGCGNSDSVPALDMLSSTNYPVLNTNPDKYLTLAPGQILLANIAAAPASGKNVSIVVEGADY